MNSTAKVLILSGVSIVRSIVFLLAYKATKEKQRHSKVMVMQNLYNIPLCVVAFMVLFISPHDDPMLGLWALTAIALLIPTVIAYLAFGLIIPAVKLVKIKQEPQPQLYWGNVVIITAEVIAGLMMI